jgi:hypothetical protein
MSAFDAMVAARNAGISLRVDAGDLLWEASQPPSPVLLASLAEHKPELLLLLKRGQAPWNQSEWQTFYELRYQAALTRGGATREQAADSAFECCIAEWLDQNPAPSKGGICAYCAEGDRPGAPVVPHGIAPEEYTWLHSQCWQAWSRHRKAEAAAAVTKAGILAAKAPDALPRGA